MLSVVQFATAFGLEAIFVGPVAAEVAPLGLTRSAIGIIGGVSEVFGMGAAPAAVDWVTAHYELHSVFYLAVGDLAFGFLMTLGLRETAPLRRA